ncbi:MAG: hypothetical protein ACNA7G_12305 [Methylobacter sp.]
MQLFTSKIGFTLALAISAMLVMNPAFADKPSHGGHNKTQKQQKQGKKQKHKKAQGKKHHARPSQKQAVAAFKPQHYFDNRHRTVVQNYYVEQFRAGACPPGLLKKQNGCLPPGQAKQWSVGRPLPRDVVYYELPPTVINQLGPPPQPDYRYVRVGDDVLLMTLGTRLVIDAIQGLNWR